MTNESAINDCNAEHAEHAKTSGVPWWREWQAAIKDSDHYAGFVGFTEWVKARAAEEEARIGEGHGFLANMLAGIEDTLSADIALYSLCCDIFDAGVAFAKETR